MALKSEREAAKTLGVDIKTLSNWRWRGVGPSFIKFPSGGVRYDDEAIAAFKAANSFTSTAEAKDQHRHYMRLLRETDTPA